MPAKKKKTTKKRAPAKKKAPAKKSVKKFIDISPHRSIMTKIAQTGYSIQEALSELIDNAIDARVPKQKLKVTIDITPDMVVVSDNARGMTEEDTAKSIRLGFSEKKGQLGEFGLGLKTSTSFLGSSFTLITTPKGGKEEFVLEYDEQHWLEHGDWYEYPFLIRRGVSPTKSGTTVIIKDLKVKFSDELLKTIQEEFGMRFGPFIKNDELELVFNKEVAKPFVPELLNAKRTQFNIAFKGGRAKGWWGYQLRRLNKDYFGFHTFRRGRLVTTHDKVGLNPNQDIIQIIGEMDVEGIPITHDKKGWSKESNEYKDMKKKLREHFTPLHKKPKRILSGAPASSGRVLATARKINMFMSGNLSKEMKKIKKGDIIVTEMTRPHFLLGIRRSGGIITDLGGNLCHAAIVAREFNIPCVTGTQNATKIIKDGSKVILDANDGSVYEY